MMKIIFKEKCHSPYMFMGLQQLYSSFIAEICCYIYQASLMGKQLAWFAKKNFRLDKKSSICLTAMCTLLPLLPFVLNHPPRKIPRFKECDTNHFSTTYLRLCVTFSRWLLFVFRVFLITALRQRTKRKIYRSRPEQLFLVPFLGRALVTSQSDINVEKEKRK